ncbi:MAG: sulfatase [Acidobacteriota bacterium]
MRRPIGWVVGACVGLVLAGCQPASQSGDTDEGQASTTTANVFADDGWRLLADDPTGLLDSSTLVDVRAVTTWRFDTGGSWRLEPDNAGTPTRMGLKLAGAALRPALVWPVDLEADQVDAIEIELGARSPAPVALFWRVDGDDSEPLPKIVLQRSDSTAGVYRFPVAGNVAWRGRVTSLRLELPGGRAGAPVRILRASALSRESDAGKLAEATRRGWKITLDDDTRNAMLLPPDTERSSSRRIEAGTVLRFGYGLEAGVRRPVRFRVDATVGDQEIELFDDTLSFASGDTGRWHDAEVDLEPVAGKTAVLRFSTEAGEGYSAAAGVPVLANPRLVRPAESSETPDIVLVVIDTLRADHLSLYGYPVRTSPRLDAWAKRSTVFRQVVAQAPWTLPSHASLFTGLDAIRHGVNHDVGGAGVGLGAVPTGSLDMLAERLREAGYLTAAITGGAYLHPRYGFTQGFDRYRTWKSRAQSDAEFSTGVDHALELLATPRDRPVFLFLHTYAVHDPYAPRGPHFGKLYPDQLPARGRIAIQTEPSKPVDGFRQNNYFVHRKGAESERLGEADLAKVRAFYDSGIAAMDRQLGRLFKGIRGREGTVIAVTSDHGEALGEHGRVGHVELTDESLLVPLVLRIPGVSRREVDDQVRLIDLMPTFLELAGEPVPEGIDGVSLLPLLRGETSPVPPEAWAYSATGNRGFALRHAGRLKAILDDNAFSPTPGRLSLFDLRADPDELVDLATDSAATERWRGRLIAEAAQRAVGLELTVANTGPDVLEAVVTGSMVRPVGTKSADLACADCVTWRAMGSLELRVPAGTRFTLRFEKVFGTQLDIAGRFGNQTFRHQWQVDQLDLPTVFGMQNGRWQTGADPMTLTTGFVAGWRGMAAIAAESPALLDPELREQLEALGYL